MHVKSVLQLHPSYQVWKLNNLWQQELKNCLQPLGLTYVEFIFLTVLVIDVRGKAMQQKQVAMRAKTDKNMTSQVLKSLQTKQLISRQESKVDRRAVSIRATQKGKLKLMKATQHVRAAEIRCLKNLGHDVPLSELLKNSLFDV